MITIGVDAHKRVHVAVAFDTGGREVGVWSGPNTPGSWSRLRTWAASLGEPRMWGIEGAWNYGRGLAQHLVAAGDRVRSERALDRAAATWRSSPGEE